MGDGTLIAVVAFAAVILAVLIWFAVSTVKSVKGKTKEYKELDEQEENETVDEEAPKLEQKRGVVIDKKCEVLKEGLHVPYVESVWAIQIAATDGTTDSCFVNEETFASVNKGDAVTYFKEGDLYYINGTDEDN
ncbi:MAG: hypothetical protein IJS45_08280 [Clostridia bacterium]|nr:hypothetical protein [Clostridia bacterium]